MEMKEKKRGIRMYKFVKECACPCHFIHKHCSCSCVEDGLSNLDELLHDEGYFEGMVADQANLELKRQKEMEPFSDAEHIRRLTKKEEQKYKSQYESILKKK